MTLGPSTWSYNGLPNLQYPYDDLPFQAGPEFWQLKTYGQGAGYSGPSVNSHITHFPVVIPDVSLPLLPNPSDFFRNTLPDFLNLELTARGYNVIAVAVGEYEDTHSIGPIPLPGTLGYEYAVVIADDSRAQAEWLAAQPQTAPGGGTSGLAQALDDAETVKRIIIAVVTGALATLLALTGNEVAAVVVVAVGALVAIPGLADQVDQIIQRTINGAFKAGLGPFTNQTLELLVAGAAVFVGVAYLLNKGSISGEAVKGAAGATGLGVETAQLPFRNLERATPLIRATGRGVQSAGSAAFTSGERRAQRAAALDRQRAQERDREAERQNRLAIARQQTETARARRVG